MMEMSSGVATHWAAGAAAPGSALGPDQTFGGPQASASNKFVINKIKIKFKLCLLQQQKQMSLWTFPSHSSQDCVTCRFTRDDYLHPRQLPLLYTGAQEARIGSSEHEELSANLQSLLHVQDRGKSRRAAAIGIPFCERITSYAAIWIPKASSWKSTESGLLRMLSDILSSVDKQC